LKIKALRDFETGMYREIHEDLKIPEQRGDSAISAVWPEWSTVKRGIQVRVLRNKINIIDSN